MTPRTTGRVAIISGGARGIGLAVADALAAGGVVTVVLDNDSSPDGTTSMAGVAGADELGGRHSALMCDIADPDQVADVVARVVEEHGRIDAVVAVAGISRPATIRVAPFDEVSHVYDVHLAGHVNLVTATLPWLDRSPAGRIVLTSSTAGLIGSPRQPAYGAAKMAIAEMTRILARQLEGTEILVNCIAPTATTRLSRGLVQAKPADIAEDLDEAFKAHEPEEVGDLVAILCSAEHASTGEVFLAAGGYLQQLELPRRNRSLFGAHELIARGTFRDGLRWGLANPNLDTFSAMPTRWFVADEPFRTWESIDVISR